MVRCAPGWIRGRPEAVCPLWHAAKRLLVFVWAHFPSRQAKPLGLKMLFLVAFSEPPSGSAWLENAPHHLDKPYFRFTHGFEKG